MADISCYGIIPARYASTRLPGKPLLDIAGRPMFWHVFDRARRSSFLRAVWVATDDERIMTAAREWGIPCLLTRSDHPSGTDRVREAAAILDLPPDAVIVNIQGDEPLLEPAALDDLLASFSGGGTGAATLATPLDPVRDAGLIASPHQVKVVVNLHGEALYFSRSPIPFARDGNVIPHYLGHIGIYAFRRDILETVTSLPPSPLEKAEQLEQLRFLEHNVPLRVVLTGRHARGVDTPDDLSAVRAVFAVQSR